MRDDANQSEAAKVEGPQRGMRLEAQVQLETWKKIRDVMQEKGMTAGEALDLMLRSLPR